MGVYGERQVRWNLSLKYRLINSAVDTMISCWEWECSATQMPIPFVLGSRILGIQKSSPKIIQILACLWARVVSKVPKYPPSVKCIAKKTVLFLLILSPGMPSYASCCSQIQLGRSYCRSNTRFVLKKTYRLAFVGLSTEWLGRCIDTAGALSIHPFISVS